MGKNARHCWSQDDLDTGLRFFSMTIQRPESPGRRCRRVRILNKETMDLEDEFRSALPVCPDRRPT
jgi:hypothetical protein